MYLNYVHRKWKINSLIIVYYVHMHMVMLVLPCSFLPYQWQAKITTYIGGSPPVGWWSITIDHLHPFYLPPPRRYRRGSCLPLQSLFCQPIAAPVDCLCNDITQMCLNTCPITQSKYWFPTFFHPFPAM